MGLLDGKIALIASVTNKFSLGWAIAQALNREGARLALVYQGDRTERSVRQLAETVEGTAVFQCDVTEEAQIDALFAAVQQELGGLDTLVHAMAYAPTEALAGSYLATQREAFRVALEVSCYSFTAMLQRAAPLMAARGGGSALTLTYLGGERVFPGYNVMGVAKAALEMSVRYLAWDLGEQQIRVNAISAGPASTASSRAIAGYLDMAHLIKEAAPLRRANTTSEVGDAALFLASNLSSGVTGEVLHVDAGYHAMGSLARHS